MRQRVFVIISAAAVVVLAALLTAFDMLIDAGQGWLPDVALDFVDRLLMLCAMFLAAWVVLRMSRLRRETDDLVRAVGQATDEGRVWRAQSRRFVDGLSRAIDAQFDAWHLTPAEADVAGLLLKGAALREIAVLRRTSEATVRQQAQVVYRKSGLGSRTELSAYFLEDLFALGEAAFEPPDGQNLRFDA